MDFSISPNATSNVGAIILEWNNGKQSSIKY